MRPSLDSLLAISSEAIVARGPSWNDALRYLHGWRLGEELGRILCTRNGFWAYELSMLVRPFTSKARPLGLLEWNQPELWKGKYVEGLQGALFFAEDAFGFQYSLLGEGIAFFDPESCQFEKVAASFEEWAQIIMVDYEYRTGFSASHDWQTKNHPLKPGTRLLPKVPFILGGGYEAAGLYACDEVQAMVFRASIANQIRNVPDGSQVTLEIMNHPDQAESDGNTGPSS